MQLREKMRQQIKYILNRIISQENQSRFALSVMPFDRQLPKK